MSVSWYLARDPDGSVSRVIRIHDEANALWGEYLRDGVWVKDQIVLDVRTDDVWGSPVSAAEGEAAARSFGAED